MLKLFPLAVGGAGAYCSNHPGASSCSTDSLPAELFAIILAALIVAAVIFNIWWKFGNPDSDTPAMRLFYAVNRLFGRGRRH